jgi:hypothetical protein
MQAVGPERWARLLIIRRSWFEPHPHHLSGLRKQGNRAPGDAPGRTGWAHQGRARSCSRLPYRRGGLLGGGQVRLDLRVGVPVVDFAVGVADLPHADFLVDSGVPHQRVAGTSAAVVPSDHRHARSGGQPLEPAGHVVRRPGEPSARAKIRSLSCHASLAGDRPDLLAEVAGVALGWAEGRGHVYEARAQAEAELCRLAGADEALILQWV